MIQIQVLAIESLAAVLTGVPVALEDIVPGELHLFPRHPVKKDEENHARNADAPPGSLHHVRVGFASAEVAPAFEVVGGKTPVFRMHHLCMALAQKSKSPAGGADVNRLPQPIQDKNMSIEEHRRLVKGRPNVEETACVCQPAP